MKCWYISSTHFLSIWSIARHLEKLWGLRTYLTGSELSLSSPCLSLGYCIWDAIRCQIEFLTSLLLSNSIPGLCWSDFVQSVVRMYWCAPSLYFQICSRVIGDSSEQIWRVEVACVGLGVYGIHEEEREKVFGKATETTLDAPYFHFFYSDFQNRKDFYLMF